MVVVSGILQGLGKTGTNKRQHSIRQRQYPKATASLFPRGEWRKWWLKVDRDGQALRRGAVTPQGSQENKHPKLVPLHTKCLPIISQPAPFRSQRAREPVTVVHKSQVSRRHKVWDQVRKDGLDLEGKSPCRPISAFSPPLPYQQVELSQHEPFQG